jgi:hypothetical protein
MFRRLVLLLTRPLYLTRGHHVFYCSIVLRYHMISLFVLLRDALVSVPPPLYYINPRVSTIVR